MTTCHLLSNETSLALCHPFIKAGDSVVFQGAAVQCLLNPQSLPNTACFFMSDDVTARGLNVDPNSGTALSVADFVGLLIIHDKQVAWP